MDQVGRLLSQGIEREGEAIHLLRRLVEEGVLRGFSQARTIPKRQYTLADLRLNKIDTSAFLSPTDGTLTRVRNGLRLSFFVGLTVATLSGVFHLTDTIKAVVSMAFLVVIDQLGTQGGVEAMLIDSAGRILSPTYARRVALHEAGHFLVAYLMGLVPRGYTLSSWEAFQNTGNFNFQAGTLFCDEEFREAIASGSLKASMLDTFACVALAGVATEWMRFGSAEGGLGDVQQLDTMLLALRFSQAKADDEVRWAVLNTVELLRRHSTLQDELADAMMQKKSVPECMAIIEENLGEDI